MSNSMAAERSRSRRPLLALGSVAALAGAGYMAERIQVARWVSGPDQFRNEPQTVTGVEQVVESADGARLHVVIAEPKPGSGATDEDPANPAVRTRTVVLAHGYTATAHHWAPVAHRLLERGLKVVVFDQRGHGHSDGGSGEFSTDRLADDLAAVVSATAPTGAVLAGHSMGGMGLQAMLANHPEIAVRLRGVVLVATLARPVSVPLGRLMSRMGGTALARRMMAHRVHGRILARGGLGNEPAVTVLDVVRHGWAACPDETRAGVMRDLRDYDFTATLATTAVPTTVVCGELDHVTPLAENQRIAELLPSGRLLVIPGAGHALPWEAADRVAEIIAGHAFTDPTNGDTP